MPVKALIVVAKARTDDPSKPAALLRSGGLSALERALRQLARLGVAEVVIVAERFQAATAEALHGFRRAPKGISLEAPQMAAALFAGMYATTNDAAPDEWLIIGDPTLIDERILTALRDRDGQVVAINDLPLEAALEAAPVTRIESAGAPAVFASCAKVAGTVLAAHVKALGGMVALSTLAEELLASGQARPLKFSEIPTYRIGLRREVPLIWLPLATERQARRATTRLLWGSQKGVQDWPARFLHRPVEFFVVARIAEWPVTPNQITVVGGLVGFLACYLFIIGQPLVAMLLAISTGIMDGFDGKLARIRLEGSKLGEMEHLLDKAIEYSWYIGLGVMLWRQGYGTTPIVLGVGLSILFATDEFLRELYRWLAARQQCDATEFDRRFRLIAGCRNTLVWTSLPLGVMGWWHAVIWFMAGYGLLTFAVHVRRFIYNTLKLCEAESQTMRRNIDALSVFRPKIGHIPAA